MDTLEMGEWGMGAVAATKLFAFRQARGLVAAPWTPLAFLCVPRSQAADDAGLSALCSAGLSCPGEVPVALGYDCLLAVRGVGWGAAVGGPNVHVLIL
jgi:hypothetical protein